MEIIVKFIHTGYLFLVQLLLPLCASPEEGTISKQGGQELLLYFLRHARRTCRTTTILCSRLEFIHPRGLVIVAGASSWCVRLSLTRRLGELYY